MKYGIFSDVHSNLEAFKVVLDVLREEGIDRYLFLGDLVGYSADPKECISLFKDFMADKECISVGGNHDYAVSGLTDYSNYEPNAQRAIEWTRNILEESDKEFLADMKLVERVEDITLVHASLYKPKEWWYIFDIDDAYPCFKLLETPICFNGHSHRPVVFIAGEMVDWIVENDIILEKDMRYIINVGSVGQPRDGNPDASFAVYDTETRRIQIKRVKYDVVKAQEKIIAAGLPRILAERLSFGK